MPELLPAILVHDEATFYERLLLMESVATTIHIDVMDGVFVPQSTWFDAEALRRLDTPLRLELHLMVRDPGRIINETQDTTSIIRHLWHIEAAVNHGELIRYCHSKHQEAGLAISPKIPPERLSPYINDIDEILVMGNEPGFSGQELEPHTIERARELHASFPSLCLGFDIGVNSETIPSLKKAGVSRFCAASAIFNTPHPSESFNELKRLAEKKG